MFHNVIKMINFLNKKDGFTLIETIVTVVVISIVMGIVLTSTQKNVSDAKIQQYMAELKTVKYAVVQYHEANKTWPVNSNGSVAGTTNIDVKLGKYYDGAQLEYRWGAGCNAAAGYGVYPFVHHLGGDVFVKLVPEFQKVCPYGVTTLSNDINWGNVVRCIIKPNTEIAAAQCN